MASDALTGPAQVTSLANAIMGKPDALTRQQCPRCGESASLRLEKADPQAHTCYRCRPCGHIFSPRIDD